jgi:hypothetical protein
MVLVTVHHFFWLTAGSWRLAVNLKKSVFRISHRAAKQSANRQHPTKYLWNAKN